MKKKLKFQMYPFLLLIFLMLTYVTLSAQTTIAWVQKPGMPSPQSGLIQALENQGYIVDTLYTPFNYTTLGTYDLVVVSRTVDSGDFTSYTSWNSLSVPVMVLSPFCITNSALKLINGSVVTNYDGSQVSTNLVTNGTPVANGDATYDGVFSGVTTGGASFNYNTWFYDYMNYTPANFVTDSNTGKPLVVLAPNASVGAGKVLMARWSPGSAAYSGAGTHSGYRTYMNIGADDDLGTHINMVNYTSLSLQLFLNEVAFLLNPCTSPVITSQPSNQAVCSGNNASFSVTATGSGLTYQWQLSTDGGSTWNNQSNGGVYSNMTAATMNITGATSGMNSYKYRCIVNVSCSSSATSNAVTLTVNAAPSISSNPSNSTINVGGNASFSVTSAGTGLTYQWQLSTNGGSTWSNQSNGGVYSNMTTATMNITSATSGMNSYKYRCIVSGTCSPSATSSAATLTVNSGTLTADYYVDYVNGSDSNSGTDINHPIKTMEHAYALAISSSANHRLFYFRGGHYYPQTPNSNTPMRLGDNDYEPLTGGSRASGAPGDTIKWYAYPGETPIIDLSNINTSLNTTVWGCAFSGDYFHWKGFEVTGFPQVNWSYVHQAFVLDAVNHCVFENIIVHDNYAMGLNLVHASDQNLILNCDAYDNSDPESSTDPYGNADGIHVGYTLAGSTNIIRGCRSWHNSDDGYDGFFSAGTVIFDHCWSWANGFYKSGSTYVHGGDGLGFKLGNASENSTNFLRQLNNCVSFDNYSHGYSQNFDSDTDFMFRIELYNCTSYNNGHSTNGQGFGFNKGLSRSEALTYVRNCVDYYSGYTGFFNAISTNTSGAIDHNSWTIPLSISSTSIWESVSETDAAAARNSDGSLPDNGLFRPSTGSVLIDAGYDYGYGTSIGAYEPLNKSATIKNQTSIETKGSQENSYRIYPNPVKDKLLISFANKMNTCSFKLYDINGIKLFESTDIGISAIDVRSYPSGVYILHIKMDSKLNVVKIIKSDN